LKIFGDSGISLWAGASPNSRKEERHALKEMGLAVGVCLFGGRTPRRQDATLLANSWHFCRHAPRPDNRRQ
jgi:hypothetical protein